jgi:hypothetical protein
VFKANLWGRARSCRLLSLLLPRGLAHLCLMRLWIRLAPISMGLLLAPRAKTSLFLDRRTGVVSASGLRAWSCGLRVMPGFMTVRAGRGR